MNYFGSNADGIGADGHEFAMGHIDDAHLTEDDCKSKRHEQSTQKRLKPAKPCMVKIENSSEKV